MLRSRSPCVPSFDQTGHGNANQSANSRRISNAEENDSDCLIVPLSSDTRLIKISTRCPLNCESKYTVSSRGQKKEYSGHQYRVRVTLMIHLIHVLDTSGEQEAFDLLTQTDESGKPYQISHFCQAGVELPCLEETYSRMEPKLVNDRQSVHQHGNRLCDCAGRGRPSLSK